MSTRAKYQNGFLTYYDSADTAKGVIQPGAAVVLEDDFLFGGVALAAAGVYNDTWTLISTAGETPTMAHVAGIGGYVLVDDNHIADDDVIWIHSQPTWRSDKLCALEVRLSMATITTCAMFIGFSDAITPAGQKMPIDWTADALVSTAVDAAGFVFDDDSTAKVWRCLSVANNVDGTTTSGGTIATGLTTAAPVATVMQTFRVETTNPTGDLAFYIDGVKVASQVAGLRPTIPMYIWIGQQHRGGHADGPAFTIDYIKAWQKR